MPSGEQLLQQLERKRARLNQRLMKTRSLHEANRIERELWALRTAISYHKTERAKRDSPHTASVQLP